MTFKTDKQLQVETAERTKRTFNVSCRSIAPVTAEELKGLDRDNIDGDTFNRIVATARVCAQNIDLTLNGYKSIGPTLGDPYSMLTGHDEKRALEEVRLLHKLLVFLNAW